MDLGKIVRDEEDRGIRWAAAAAAFVGLATIVSVLLPSSAAGQTARTIGIAVGVIELALAYGVYRGSRACVVAALAMFVLDRLVLVAQVGVVGLLNVWTLVLGAALVAGVRAAYARRGRPAGVRR